MILQQPILSILLGNAIHDIDMGDGRKASMAFRDHGKAAMRRADGTVLNGAWQVEEEGYSVDWDGGPSARWRLSATPGRIAYVDAGGVERGLVTGISFIGAGASASWLDGQ